MHNLFLGTENHVFSVWIETGILSKKSLKSIEENLKLFKVPNDVGRLPSQISSFIYCKPMEKLDLCIFMCDFEGYFATRSLYMLETICA